MIFVCISKAILSAVSTTKGNLTLKGKMEKNETSNTYLLAIRTSKIDP